MRLTALRNHLSPVVRNTISNEPHDPSMYNLATARLYEEYGNDIAFFENIDKLLSLLIIKSNGPVSLKKFPEMELEFNIHNVIFLSDLMNAGYIF